ncbi:MAG TPA: hypothetical protein VH741_03455, partial [Candidatus Limnocylindrales bacterium]
DLLAEDVPAAALELGRRAQAGLAGVLATAAARELGQGRSVDIARLVPEYVALPRGVPAASAEMAWSPDLR